MDITDVPFHKFIGVQKSPGPDGATLSLDNLPQYKNHYGSVHAAAQFALAEAASGHLLIRRFGQLADLCIPIVRKADMKFRRAAFGKVVARPHADDDALRIFLRDLTEKGTGVVQVDVDVEDENGNPTMTASFEWYAKKREEGSQPLPA